MLETNRKILFFDIDGTLITDDGGALFPGKRENCNS